MRNGDKPITPTTIFDSSENSFTPIKHLGLTKREHIAALAMQGLLTRLPVNTVQTDLGVNEVKRIAEEAVIAADTLLSKLEEEY